MCSPLTGLHPTGAVSPAAQVGSPQSIFTKGRWDEAKRGAGVLAGRCPPAHGHSCVVVHRAWPLRLGQSPRWWALESGNDG